MPINRAWGRALTIGAEALAMALLDFARGPGLGLALAIFAGGLAWRIFPLVSRTSGPRASAPRAGGAAIARTVLARLWPRPPVRRSHPALDANAFAWHAALGIVILGFAPHIAFVKRLTGASWPAFPGWALGLAVSVALYGLLFALMARLASPVTRLVSTLDDYASWALTVLPFVTGMGVAYLPLDAAYPPLPDRPTALALHLLSFELLLAWLPFGKLAHAVLAFASRGVSASAAARKGAAA